MSQTMADLREDYTLTALNEADVDPNPIVQFKVWFNQALGDQLPEPNAMTLATATPDGIPSARIVLLKAIDDRGFVFFTNYDSHKSQELKANPQAALVFLWHQQERQIRVQGSVLKIAESESDEYFYSRPLSSRIGAWASPQSRVIPDRACLEVNQRELEQTYTDSSVPRPQHWGGWRVQPRIVEFWQGRSSRLHDRLRYTLVEGLWRIDRLAP